VVGTTSSYLLLSMLCPQYRVYVALSGRMLRHDEEAVTRGADEGDDIARRAQCLTRMWT
jgi:hypothetical protein